MDVWTSILKGLETCFKKEYNGSIWEELKNFFCY